MERPPQQQSHQLTPLTPVGQPTHGGGRVLLWIAGAVVGMIVTVVATVLITDGVETFELRGHPRAEWQDLRRHQLYQVEVSHRGRVTVDAEVAREGKTELKLGA
jgi:hypothetical protein